MDIRHSPMWVFFFSTVAITVYGALQVSQNPMNLAAWGVLLSAISYPVYMANLVLPVKNFKTARRMPVFHGVSFVGLVLAMIAAVTSTGFVTLAIWLSVYAFLIHTWYVYAHGIYQPRDSVAIKPGKQFPPDLPFTRLDGNDITASEFHGTRTLLVFYRGNWCPFCVEHVKDIAKNANKFLELGVNLKFISNQSIKHSQQLANRVNKAQNIEFLVDTDLRAAIPLKLSDIGGAARVPDYPIDTVYATSILLSETGIIIYGDEAITYRIRAGAEVLLEVCKAGAPSDGPS